MVGFIDAHRDAHGVEPICDVLPIAPATYYDHLAKRADPARLSDRAKRDEALRPEIRRVFEDNWSVYGLRKVWHQLRREGFDIARCTVARLMKDMGIQGIIRGKPHKTTIPDKKQPCPLDKVNRQFRVPAPNMLWVSDFTYVATWKGFVYVAFVIDAYARKIVGWRVSTSAYAGFVLDALEQAVHDRRPVKGMGLVHHSDRGSQYLSIKYTERLAEAGPAQDFIEAWSAAGGHLQSCTHDAKINWLKADPNPPFLEHLSFRLGNQLFFVRIEDVDGRLQTPGTLDSLKSIANDCNGHACLMPIKHQEGYWKPREFGWGLIDARTGSSIDPYALVTEDKVEMTDAEIQHFAVQVVRDYVREKLGHQIISSHGYLEVAPSIWFVGDNGPEWIVVRAVRYPESNALLPRNILDIARDCSRVGTAGHFASVAVANSEQPGTTMVEPLWRGHGMHVRFQGLQPPLELGLPTNR